MKKATLILIAMLLAGCSSLNTIKISTETKIDTDCNISVFNECLEQNTISLDGAGSYSVTLNPALETAVQTELCKNEVVKKVAHNMMVNVRLINFDMRKKGFFNAEYNGRLGGMVNDKYIQYTASMENINPNYVPPNMEELAKLLIRGFSDKVILFLCPEGWEAIK
jgi:hypothetical protein